MRDRDRQGQTDEGGGRAHGVIKIREADFGTYQTLGMINQKKEDGWTPWKCTRRRFSSIHRVPMRLQSLAACQASGGQLSDAVISYEQVVMMDTGARGSHQDLAEIYREAGQ